MREWEIEKPARRARLEKRRFHDLQAVERDMREMFDINVAKDLTDDDKAFAKRIFHRRHVYEHRGVHADQKYINDSGENDVRVGQALRESIETAHRIVGIVHKMVHNVHAGSTKPFRWINDLSCGAGNGGFRTARLIPGSPPL